MRHRLTVAVGPAVWRIGSDLPQPIRALARLYAAYPAPTRPADFTVRLETSWTRRWVRRQLRLAGDYAIPAAAPLPLAQGLLAAEMAMNLQLAFGWRAHALIHAGAVARPLGDGGDGAILLPGASGSGKSTLAALLGEGAGGSGGGGDWRLMGDEFALLSPRDGMLYPMPRPVSLKNDAIPALLAAVPGIDAARLGPTLTGTPKGTIRHLVPRPAALAAMQRPARPRAILFPTFGTPAGWRPLAPAETFTRLTEGCANYVALGEAGFAALTRLASAVPAFDFGYPDGATGAAMVAALWADLPPIEGVAGA